MKSSCFRWFFAAFLCSFTLMGTASSAATHQEEFRPKATILDRLAVSKNYETLTAALRATGLDQVLDGDDSLTLFAPSDAAFAKLGEARINALIANPQALKTVLLYHVVPGRLGVIEALKKGQAEAANGEKLSFSFQFPSAQVNEAKIKYPNLLAKNGVIHAIDQVLLPSLQSIAAVAAGNADFSVLNSALQATGLDIVLAAEGPFTVFAPTDKAFAKLGKKTLAAIVANADLLREILLYHVVTGVAVDAMAAAQLSSATMANGDPVSIRLVDGELLVNESKVVVKDIIALNGIIHVIDTVLLP